MSTKKKTGRPSKWDPDFVHQLEKYVSQEPYREVFENMTYKNGDQREYYRQVPNDYPSVQAFARRQGVHRDTIYEWAKQHKEFSDILKRLEDTKYEFLTVNGLNGNYNASSAIFAKKNELGWRDQQHLDLTTKGRPIVQVPKEIAEKNEL